MGRLDHPDNVREPTYSNDELQSVISSTLTENSSDLVVSLVSGSSGDSHVIPIHQRIPRGCPLTGVVDQRLLETVPLLQSAGNVSDPDASSFHLREDIINVEQHQDSGNDQIAIAEHRTVINLQNMCHAAPAMSDDDDNLSEPENWLVKKRNSNIKKLAKHLRNHFRAYILLFLIGWSIAVYLSGIVTEKYFFSSFRNTEQKRADPFADGLKLTGSYAERLNFSVSLFTINPYDDCINVNGIRNGQLDSSKLCFKPDVDNSYDTSNTRYETIDIPRDAFQCGRFSKRTFCCWTRELRKVYAPVSTQCFVYGVESALLTETGWSFMDFSTILPDGRSVLGIQENRNIKFLVFENVDPTKILTTVHLSRQWFTNSYDTITYAFPGNLDHGLQELVANRDGEAMICTYKLSMDSFETGASKEKCELVQFKLPDRTAQYKYRLCSTENYLALATYKAFSPGKNNESDEWNLQVLMKATNAISNVRGKTTLPVQLELRCKNENLSVITINGSKLKRLDYKILVPS